MRSTLKGRLLSVLQRQYFRMPTRTAVGRAPGIAIGCSSRSVFQELRFILAFKTKQVSKLTFEFPEQFIDLLIVIFELPHVFPWITRSFVHLNDRIKFVTKEWPPKRFSDFFFITPIVFPNSRFKQLWEACSVFIYEHYLQFFNKCNHAWRYEDLLFIDIVLQLMECDLDFLIFLKCDVVTEGIDGISNRV